ncbi:triose-phosphate isomerase [Nanoarchaeota archaeon]
MKPLIGLNFKKYKQATGKNALKLLKILDKYRNNVKMLAGVYEKDYSYVKKVKIPVYSQKLHIFEVGEAKKKGLKGTFLNHSDHRLKFDVLKEIVKECKKKKFSTIVFAASLKEAKKIISLRPDYVAYEDPLLIGTTRSITKYRSGKVKAFVGMCKGKTIPLCGAGIHEKEDLDAAIKLGCKGILMASAFVKSRDPNKFIKDFVKRRGKI